MHRMGFSSLVASLVASTWLGIVAYADESIDYIRDIRPILSDNCYACHGPDEGSREAELRLDMHESTIGELPSGEKAVVPGKPDESELLRRIVAEDEDELMPPAETGKSLKPEQVELIRRWIEHALTGRIVEPLPRVVKCVFLRKLSRVRVIATFKGTR